MVSTRRQLVVAIVGLGAGRGGLRQVVAAQPATTVRTIAAMTHVSLPAPPLALALARASLPAGVDVPAATAGGVRVIVPENGPVVARATTRGSVGPDDHRPLGLPGDIPVSPGAALALAAADLAALRNPGPNPVMVLDAAVFPAGDRPPPAALTTAAGVQVRLLAYGVLDDLPPARFDVTLLDAEIDPLGEAPPSLAVGPLLARVEAGSVVVFAAGPGVFTASSAGRSSLAGLATGRLAVVGVAVPLAGGSAVFMRAAAAARIVASGPSPARLLILRLGESEIS